MIFDAEVLGINEVEKKSQKTGTNYAIATLKMNDEIFDVYCPKKLGINFGEVAKVRFELDLKYKQLKAVDVL